MTKNQKWIIGIDEVGRGPLAGPVTVCAVAIPVLYFKKISTRYQGVKLTDSKKMTARDRTLWFDWATDNKNKGIIRFDCVHMGAKKIDDIGITKSIRQAINQALTSLDLDPNHCEVYLDGGLRAPIFYKKQQTIIRGDLYHRAISLASVIAKVTRDTLMERYGKRYPEYGFEKHKGYGTQFHRFVLQQKGILPIHRKTFVTRILYKI